MRSLTVRSTTPGSSDMTGSRLDFWLQALTSAFNDNGYWSGVMTAFSMRQPMTRASLAVSSMFNDVPVTQGVLARDRFAVDLDARDVYEAAPAVAAAR